MISNLLSRRTPGIVRGVRTPVEYDVGKAEEAYGDGWPDPFPKGWYKLAMSDELEAGADPVPVRALGHDFVMFRGANDHEVHVLDAHCPHLGAHLGIGGRVVGDNVECPFHRWQYAGKTGVCQLIHSPDGAGSAPFKPKQKTAARVRRWPTLEQYGMVMLYFDPDVNNADPTDVKQPPYQPLSIPEVDEGRFSLRYMKKPSTPLPAHLLDYMDNAGDLTHFRVFHRDIHIPVLGPLLGKLSGARRGALMGGRLEIDMFFQDYTLGTESNGGKHLSYLEQHAILRLFKKRVKGTVITTHATFCGPGSLTYMRFGWPEKNDPDTDIMVVQSLTPVKPRVLHIEYACYAHPKTPRFLLWYLTDNMDHAFQDDRWIWRTRVMRHKPHLCKNDKVMKNRHFYEQFCRPGFKCDW